MKLLRRKEKNAKSTQREDVIFYIGDIFSMPLSKSSILSEKFSSLLTTWGTLCTYTTIWKNEKMKLLRGVQKISQREGFYSCVMLLSFFYYYSLFVCLVQCAMLHNKRTERCLLYISMKTINNYCGWSYYLHSKISRYNWHKIANKVGLSTAENSVYMKYT